MKILQELSSIRKEMLRIEGEKKKLERMEVAVKLRKQLLTEALIDVKFYISEKTPVWLLDKKSVTL